MFIPILGKLQSLDFVRLELQLAFQNEQWHTASDRIVGETTVFPMQT